jgi:hypothetical protein
VEAALGVVTLVAVLVLCLAGVTAVSMQVLYTVVTGDSIVAAYRWRNVDKVRRPFGLPPLRPKRKSPRVIKMTRYTISAPVTD